MVDFKQAVKWMKEGKKVRRPTYSQTCYDEILGGVHISNSSYTISDYEATDWEIYKEKDNWNLADNRNNKMFIQMASYEDIKTFIQKVKEDLKNIIIDYDVERMSRIIDKRAGDL